MEGKLLRTGWILAALLFLPQAVFSAVARVEPVSGWVVSARFSPDGAYLLAVSSGNRVSAWETGRFKLKLDFSVPEAAKIENAAFSPDGSKLALAADNGTVYVRDFPSGKEVASLTAGVLPFKAVLFSPDGELLSAADSGGGIFVWAAKDFSLLREMHAGGAGLNALAFSPDGSLASAGNDGKIRLWNARTGDLLQTLPGHYNEITALAFSPDGRRLISCDTIGVMVVHETKTWRKLKIDQPCEQAINDIAFSSASPFMVTAGDDGVLIVFETGSFSPVRVIRQYNLGALSCSFSPDGGKIAAGYLLGTLKIYDWKNSTVSARQAGTVLYDAGGLPVSTLKAGRVYEADFSSFTARGIKLKDGVEKKEYFAPHSTVYDSDYIAPVILPLVKTVSGTVTDIIAVALDDNLVTGVSRDGKPLAELPRAMDCGDFQSRYFFRLSLANGEKAEIRATDSAGKISSVVFSGETESTDAGPYFVRGRAEDNIDVFSGREKDKLPRRIKKNAFLDIVGYKKGWYFLADGTWIYSDFVTGR
ncbi:MAG: WD40 repeat domain-containing protein [Elusimicrobiaceae bacterium]